MNRFKSVSCGIIARCQRASAAAAATHSGMGVRAGALTHSSEGATFDTFLVLLLRYSVSRGKSEHLVEARTCGFGQGGRGVGSALVAPHSSEGDLARFLKLQLR